MTSLNGRGEQTGRPRPDWGDGWAELTCTDCGAGWVGPIGEICCYCIAAVEAMRRYQAEIVLAAPDVDPADKRYAGAIKGWGERLHRAVAADLVTRERARSAYEREVRRARVA